MRILFLINMYPPQSDGGYPLLCREAVEELKNRNHSVQVLTSYFQLDGPTVNDPVWRIFHYCPDNKDNEAASTGIVDLLSWYKREYREHKQLSKAVNGFSPDLVFIWATKGMSYSIPIRLMQTGLPFFGYVCGYWLTDHNNLGANRRQYQFWQWGTDKPIFGFIKKVFLNQLNQFFPVKYSPLSFDGLAYNNIDTLKDLKQPASKTEPVQIYDSAPLDHLAGLPLKRNKRTRILFIGRLHPSKDPLTLVKACGNILASGKINIELTMVGWSHDKDYISTLKSEINATNTIEAFHFLEPVDFEEVPSLFANHDLIVVPSAVDPLPRVAAEGMAAGLPLIVSDGTGISQCLEHDKEALIFNVGDVDQLSAQIASLLNNPEKANSLAIAGRKKALSYFATNRMVDELEAFLENGLKYCQQNRKPC